MAVFEKVFRDRLELDDTFPLRCDVEGTHSLNGYTEYTIKCQRGFDNANVWWVSHRYSDFAALNSSLHAAGARLPFPKKKIIGNMNPDFIAERRAELQVYIDALLNDNILASSRPVKAFLDPTNYPSSLNEVALQNVSMALRGDGDFEFKTQLNDIGWRIRKRYYAVSRVQDDSNFVMSWQTYGPDKVLNEKDMKSALKCLSNLEHPHIDKILSIRNLEAGTYCVRKVHQSGSLRDHLYGTDYKAAYLNKYLCPKLVKPFTTGQISHYGCQILNALSFLHQKGIPHGHLHTGNIFIANQGILLTDIENSILGVPTKMRHLLIKVKKIYRMEDVDVYCFGHVLYEMAYADVLKESMCDSFPQHQSNEIISILMSILSTSACKRGMPTAEALFQHSFFHSDSLDCFEMDNAKRVRVKISSNVRENFKNVSTVIENRLKSDQKSHHLEMKNLKIKEILSSEEEIEKRRSRMKNRENNMRSSSSTNGFGSSNPCSPSERSESVASSLSNSSSHNSGETKPQPKTATSPTVPKTQERSVLLDSICSFNKSLLNKVDKS